MNYRTTVLIKKMAILYCMLYLGFANGQDVGAIKKQKSFEISGNIFVGANFNSTSRENLRRAPFSYMLNGSPTISIYGIKIPLSFTYSDQELSYAKPFQRYGTSPYYKWIKLHLGHRSLNFSPYSMTGQTFFGCRCRIDPWKI